MCCAVLESDLTDTPLATLLPEANFILLLVGTASGVQPDSSESRDAPCTEFPG
jgi:hypothetical protein